MPSDILRSQLLSWSDALTIAAIIFAITQFMETTRLRRYLFYLGWLRTVTVVLVGFPLVLVIISNIYPSLIFSLFTLMGIIFSYYFSYLLYAYSCVLFIPLDLSVFSSSSGIWNEVGKFLTNPSTYEIVALLSFSLLIFLYLAFLKNPHLFRPFFNIKLLDNISWDLLDNTKEEDLSALSKIIGSYIEEIVKRASKVPQHSRLDDAQKDEFKDELAKRCLGFIEVDLSGSNFIVYISRENVKFIMWILRYAKEYSLWNTGRNIFFDNLFNQLIKDEASVLTRELKLGGYSGYMKPVSNEIFRSMEIIDNYDVFGALGWGTDVPDQVLSNVTTGLDMSLRKYFTTDSRTYMGNPGFKLGGTVHNLAECYRSMCSDISKLDDEIWKNPHGSKMSKIMRFFDNFQYRITPVSDTRWQDPYDPKFSQADLTVDRGSLSSGLVEGFFTLYEGIAYIKNEEYARMEAIELYWLVYQEPQNQMMKVIQEKFLEKVKERIEENFKGNYASMLKVFLYLYSGELYGNDFHSQNPVALYFKEIFRSRVIPALRNNKKFREHNMPSDWKFDSKNNLYRMSYETKEIIDKASKRRGRPTIKKIVTKNHKATKIKVKK